MTTPKLLLPELAAGQGGKELAHNAAIARLDQFVNSTVLDKDLSTPPASPANGAGYIVAASPTGAWAGKANHIAFWRTSSGAWDFIAPFNGLVTWVVDETKRYEYNVGAWAEFAAGNSSPAVVSKPSSFTLGLTDTGTHMRSTSATDMTVTVPPQASVAWAVNTEMRFEQAGDGVLNFAAGAGVTIEKKPTSLLKSAYKNNFMLLKRTAADTWSLLGEIMPIVTTCAVRSSAQAVDAPSVTSIVVNKPAGTANGDIMVMFAQGAGSTAIACTGWAVQTSGNTVSGCWAILTKTAASEGASYTVTQGAAGAMNVHIVSVKGATAVDVIEPYKATLTITQPRTIASVTPTANGLLLAHFMSTGINNAITVPPPTMDIASPRQFYGYSTGIVYSEVVAAGVTGSRQLTWGTLDGSNEAMIVIR